ncbi:lysophospholipid acyltransferase family protein [Dyadobacter jiangsuensis]|uniref:KDO2-lipid IV(A) lauroyltransferase n=1 Tax=Dyadobacter jiangsuensis TaxID=1591085 RepID=A0A2P8FWQ3_9BACT|nr:lysophospholipid acyltransferase family protein [Dyadobacter jiangsuensis]PSL26158.1 KDO2-lipid IV(A) lauroyltransferase [Dyadobacter jiangsuensis]
MKAFTTHLFLILLNAVSKLSWGMLYKLSDIFRFLIFDIGQYRKKVVLSNLRNSFPTYDQQSIQAIAAKFYRNFTDIIFETIKLKSISREELLDRIDLDVSILDHYYQKNQNLVVVAGHLGNWEMLNLFGSARLRHQMVVVYHELQNDAFEDWFKNVRTRFGTEMVTMKEAISKAMQPRDRPFIFILINDQSPVPEKAFWTKFLNQDTGVFRGVELIARRLNSPVLYMAILKNEAKRGFYRGYFKLITESPKQAPNNSILQAQIGFLEQDIIRQPDNWLWSHKRWKHKKPENLPQSQLLQEIPSE